MHQLPRAPPVSASPASSEKTNPERTNNQRDQDRDRDGGRDTPPAENFSRQGQDRPDGSDDAGSSTSNPVAEVTRLNQVIQVHCVQNGIDRAKLTLPHQNFHTKAALIILHSRFNLAPAYTKGTNIKRLNKWVSRNQGYHAQDC